MVHSSVFTLLTDDELLELMPAASEEPPADERLLLGHRAALELCVARGRLELARDLLAQARSALAGGSDAERRAAAERIARGLEAL